MDLFKLVGSIFIRDEDANDKINKTKKKASELAVTVGSSMKSVGDKMTSIGQKMLPVTLAIGGLGAVAVKSSAEVKAMNSQFEQTFGELQDKASSAMNRVATESGILQTRLQGVGTSIYAFAKSSGADSAEAMELMETALRATADASAYYDRSLEETSESLMSFLKGNFANDAQLGVSCTETTRNAKAMELFGQKYNDLSEIQKQQTLLKMVTDSQKLSGAMGQASREADGFENVTGNLKESVKMLTAELGEVLLPTVVSLIQKATAFIQNLSQMDDKTKHMIVNVGLIVGAIAPTLIVLGKVVSTTGTMLTVFGKMKTTIPSIVTSVKTFGSSLSSLLISPVGVAIAVIGVLIGAFISLWKNNEEFRNKIIEIWNQVKATFEKLTSGIVERLNSLGFNFKNISEVISAIWKGLCDLLAPIFEGAFQYIADTFNTIVDIILGILDFFISIFKGDWEGAWKAIKGIFESIWTGIKNWFSNILNTMKGVLDVVCGWFGTTWSKTWTSIKTFFVNVWTSIKTFFVNVWNNIKSTVTNAINNVKSSISSGLTGAKTTVTNVLNSIKTKFSSIMDTVKTTVKNAIDKIKGFFNFSWSLPKLKMPHLTITGGFSLVPPNVPKFSVEWYKHGGIMTEPTLFDYNPLTGKARIGGEAGDEAIAPIDLLQDYVSNAVASQNYVLAEALDRLFGRLFEILEKYFPEFTKQVVLDTGVLVGELAPAIDTKLGIISTHKGRGN